MIEETSTHFERIWLLINLITDEVDWLTIISDSTFLYDLDSQQSLIPHN